MSPVENVRIALPSDIVAMVRAAVYSGEYSSGSEVILEALRAWLRRKQVKTMECDELRRFVGDGVESEPGTDAKIVFSQLRAQYAAIPPKQDK